MTPQDDYLERVRHTMAGMEGSLRDDILRELRSHIAESTAENGGNVAAALSGLGAPADVGRHYREVYGYGRRFQALFAAIAFVLAIPSIPVLAVGEQGLFPYALSLVFLVLAAAWILWVSVAAGSRTGTIAGIAAFFARGTAFAGVAASQAGAAATAGGLGLLLATSVVLILLGWLPGTAKAAFSFSSRIVAIRWAAASGDWRAAAVRSPPRPRRPAAADDRSRTPFATARSRSAP